PMSVTGPWYFSARSAAAASNPAWPAPTITQPLMSRLRSSLAFGRRYIPAGCVAPPSNIPDILGRCALPSGRLAALDATTTFGGATSPSALRGGNRHGEAVERVGHLDLAAEAAVGQALGVRDFQHRLFGIQDRRQLVEKIFAHVDVARRAHADAA